MRSKFLRVCSFVLTLVLLINMLPMSIFAEEFRESLANQEVTAPEAETAVAEDAYVVDEIVDKRTEFSKEFLLSNGLHMATVYANAVHYETENGWEEIDNTLKANADGSISNTAGVWDVTFPQELTEDESITIEKDGYTLSFFMAGELQKSNLEIADAELQPMATIPAETTAEATTYPATSIIEETLVEPTNATQVESTSEAETETTQTEQVELTEETIPETTTETTAETVPETTAVSIEEIPAETILAISKENITQIAVGNKVETFAVKGLKKAPAAIKEINLSAMREIVKYEEMVTPKAQSRLQYANIYQNTDVVYDLDSNTVKESIILERYSDDLRGYRYTLNVGTMIPVLDEDGQILFYDQTQENVVMVMPAPFMVDDAGECSNDIQVLLNGSGSTYTMTYLLPQSWLAAEDRAWPVVLDPVVSASTLKSNIKDVTVSEGKNYDNNWGMLQCGHSSTYGISRFYIMYENLPALQSSDVVVDATISLYKHADGNDVEIDVHQVDSTWTANGMIWSTKPDHDPIIEDYAIVGGIGYYTWTITDAVRDWYQNSNTGVMFKLPNSLENTTSHNIKQFRSVDYGSQRPVLSIRFQNNNGIEEYWDYTSASAGRAGTGYVNNFTGNMVWVRDDIGFGGNRMPVTISHIYNLNDAVVPSDSNNANDSANTFGMGIGWRTNYNQLLYKWELDGEEQDYYVWEDSDGTDHYFKLKDGAYKDEDGLERTLSVDGSGSTKYCITDKNENCSYFDTEGRLTRLSNNQKAKSNINITYIDSTSNLISTITDGAGRVYSFSYTGGLLEKITYKGKGTSEISSVTFGYSGQRLMSITDKDGEASAYNYTTAGLLETVQDIDGYKLTYAYNTVDNTALWKPYRTQSVSESYVTEEGTKEGGTLSFTYAHNQTTITDHNGNVEIMQFNNVGNTISVQDDEGRAQYAKYARNTDEETGKGNQLTVSSKLQTSVGNIAKNSDFEVTQIWAPNNSSALTVGRSDEASYRGSYSLKMVSSTNDLVAALTNGFYIEPGATYTFSAYVKTLDTTATIALQRGATYYTVYGAPIGTNQDWTRTQVSYTNATAESQKITPILFINSAGTAYMDNVQIERSPTASRLNIIENGDFYFTDSYGYGWTWDELTSADGPVTLTESPAPQMDSNAFKITGDPTGYRQLIQYIPHSGSAGDSYVLSGWAKGNSVPLRSNNSNEREFEIEAILHHHDGTSSRATLQFNPDSDVWQYASAAVSAQQAYFSITVIIRYNFNANTVYFDGIQLFEEEFGSSYTYDDDNNVIAVRDLQAQITNYEYDTNSNLTKIIQNNKAKMTYTYDDHHNVKTATTEKGVVYEFDYDDYGNNSEVTIGSGDSQISSTATYSDDYNRLASTTDALGKVTTYGYNADTNVLEYVQYPEDTVVTQTEYTYDEMYRMATATCYTDTELNMSVAYDYDNDLLTSITTPSTTYSFNYGDFGLRNDIKIRDRTLATYYYTKEEVNDRNYDLDLLDYGNNDSVEYTYDDKGRLLTETYKKHDTVSNTVTYTYDNSGALVKITDSATNVTTTYYYDLTDRLMKYVESGGRSRIVTYGYDELNNLTSWTELTGGVPRTTSYSYDDDNRVTEVTAGTANKTYNYDDYGRLSGTTTKNGSSNILSDSYTYTTVDGAQTAQVATHTVTVGSVSKVFTYTYDDNGNITSISDGTNTTSYVYDSANQLIRENNQAGNFIHTWTYDNAGNILTRTKYAYIEGALGTPTETVSYGYNDDRGWGDLLTSYDGDTIEYDEIGNMESDGTWSYNWEHGRQLASMSDGTNTWTYTYDTGGLRTKRTDGTDTYHYLYNGSQLTQMKVGTETLYFTYDANGTPLTVTYTGQVFYYKTNLQGDVIAIVNASGSTVVEYAYDAWGNLLSTTGTLATTIGKWNPLRYRGYVYDEETGFYYVSSRYYDPEIGRFINADDVDLLGANGDFASLNLFAYCGNNPVSRADSSGYFWNTVIGLAAGAVVGGFSALIMGTDITAGIVSGAISGAISGAAVDIAIATGGVGLVALAGVAAAGGVGGGVSSYVNQRMNGVDHDKVDWGTVAIDSAWGAVGGALSFGMADVGGKACQTLAQNLALRGTERAIQVGSDFATAAVISSGTWLNGSKMNMLYKRLG